MSKKGGHHGGAWKVAYADFTTAMMALFLCLWLTAQDTKIKEAIERAFRNPFSAVTKESVGIIPNPNKDASATYKQAGNFQSVSAVEMETMRRITDDLSRILQQQDEIEKGVEIETTSDGLRINIYDRTHKPVFETNSEVFTSYGSWVLGTLAWELSRYTTFRIEIQGHTERHAEDGAGGLNKWALSTERANASLHKLIQNGVRPSQICKVSGYADTEPIPDLPATAEANRRVTVILRMKESLDATAATAATANNASPDDRHPN